MGMTFKVKEHITCGFFPGEVRAAGEFPPGTDFERLVKNGSIRPTGLGAFRGPPSEADHLDQVEEMQAKIDELGAKLEDAEARHAEALAARDAEIAAWKDQAVAGELQVESLGLELADARKKLAGMEAKAAEAPAAPPPAADPKKGGPKNKAAGASVA